jgi:iron(III) transport system substrate-binding protein
MSRKFALALIAFSMSTQGFAATAPSTVAQIALYQGADRDKVLVEGAKREGQVTFYNSHTWFRTFVKDFEKKYPFIKVAEWRNDSKNILRRVTDEAKAGRSLADVIETTPEAIGILKRDGILQEYYSPEARFYPDDVKSKGKNGFYYVGDRETYIGLGFNTNLIPQAEAPKSLRDLLNPRWKGKMSIVTSSTGTRWIGNALDVMGREFVEKFSEQDVRLQDLSGAALSG